MFRNRLGPLVAIALAGCGDAPDQQRVAEDSVPHDVALQSLPSVDSGAPVLQPVDQANTSFRNFRAAALGALAARDTAFLFAMLAPEIRNSFGGDDSIAGFKRIWRMDEPNSAVWDALARVLKLGGKAEGDSTFIAPYVYAFWPDSIDAFDYVAVVRAHAPVRPEPASNSEAIGSLTHTIVKIDDWRNTGDLVKTDSSWAHVALPDGRQVWVNGLDVYSPVDWRAFFVKRDGRWLMQLFVAGD